MFSNLTIKSRLVFLLSALTLMLVAGASIGIFALQEANGRMEALYNKRLMAISQLDKVITMLTRQEYQITRALKDVAELPALEQAIEDEDEKVINQQWGQYYQAEKVTNEERTIADAFNQGRLAFKTEGLSPAIAALKAQDLEKAGAIIHQKVPLLFEVLREPGNRLIVIQQEEATKLMAASNARYVQVRNWCLAGLVASVLMAVAMGAWVIRSIVRPLREVVAFTSKIADGDLTHSVGTVPNDEMGQVLGALDKMSMNLTGMVQRIRKSSDAIANSSTEIAFGNQNLSARTEEQAATLEETAAAMEELNATVAQNEHNAQQGKQLAIKAADVARDGGTAVSTVVETMGAISASSKQIGEITSVIDTIAFQTNILALNASVEAARAGEQGRGFAVVATEVRALAKRSAEAAKEIKLLIQVSTEHVSQGARQVGEAGQTMQAIVHSVLQVNDIISEISSASHEQTVGIDQVTQSVTQMDQATQKNAALVEEASAGATAMQREAEELSAAVALFKLRA